MNRNKNENKTRLTAMNCVLMALVKVTVRLVKLSAEIVDLRNNNNETHNKLN